jgi:hypothetical protein
MRQLSGKRKTLQIKKLKDSNGRTITNSKEMADLLAKQFAETSSDEHYSQTFTEKKKKAEETGNTIDLYTEKKERLKISEGKIYSEITLNTTFLNDKFENSRS